jgi:hypothetical protein
MPPVAVPPLDVPPAAAPPDELLLHAATEAETIPTLRRRKYLELFMGSLSGDKGE